jgi:hypothetical protein
MKKNILSKTKLRLSGRGTEDSPNPPRARIEEMFPEIPEEVDDILFDISGEPLFPGETAPK